MKRIRRKKLIVDRAIQYQIGGVVLLCGTVATMISMIGLKILSSKVIGLLEALDTTEEMQLKVIGEFNQVSMYYILLTGVSLAWAWLLTMFVTNRVVGPVQNMMNTLDRYAAGEKSARVNLRKNDFFQLLAQKINKALDESK